MYTSHRDTWGIVLSGGDGCRLQHFTEQFYGCKRPKQYCAFVGTRTMLRHTIDRAELAISPHHIVTIIDKSHIPYAETDLCDRPMGNVIIQPCNRDTGPGMLHALIHIDSRNHNACVVIFPSDHFVKEENIFMQHIQSAITMAGVYPHIPILIGAYPCYDEVEYGWIEPGEQIEEYQKRRLHCIRSFWEKPETSIARSLHQGGCLWNTMIIVANVAVLLDLFRRYTPGIFDRFTRIQANLGSPEVDKITEEIYRTLPAVNFSRSILEPSAKRFGVLAIEGAYWSDWGNEARIRADVERFNLRMRRSTVSIPDDVAKSC